MYIPGDTRLDPEFTKFSPWSVNGVTMGSRIMRLSDVWSVLALRRDDGTSEEISSILVP